jgi:hypothetical protein
LEVCRHKLREWLVCELDSCHSAFRPTASMGLAVSLDIFDRCQIRESFKNNFSFAICRSNQQLPERLWPDIQHANDAKLLYLFTFSQPASLFDCTEEIASFQICPALTSRYRFGSRFHLRGRDGERDISHRLLAVRNLNSQNSV